MKKKRKKCIYLRMISELSAHNSGMGLIEAIVTAHSVPDTVPVHLQPSRLWTRFVHQANSACLHFRDEN